MDPFVYAFCFQLWPLRYFHYLFIIGIISVKKCRQQPQCVCVCAMIVMRATNAFAVFAYNFSYLHFCVIDAAEPIQMPNGRESEFEFEFCLCSRIAGTRVYSGSRLTSSMLFHAMAIHSFIASSVRRLSVNQRTV